LFDQGAWGDHMPQQERNTIFLNAFYRLNPQLEIFYEGFWTEREFDIRMPPLGATFNVPSSNPFFVAPNPAATSVQVQYRLLDGNADSEHYGTDRQFQHAGGLTYDFSNSWHLEVVGSYSQNKAHMIRGSLLNTVNPALVLA